MKVYREKLNYATDSSRIVRDMERLDVIKSIGVRRNYALIINELSICQSGVERIRKNTIKFRENQNKLYKIIINHVKSK